MLDKLPVPKRPARPIAAGATTMPEVFLRRVDRSPHLTAWKRKIDGQWVASTWRDFYEAAAAVAVFLMESGIGPGDKLTIVGSTRPEWCISDIGGLLAGAVTVGAYPTLTADQLAYIVEHSDSRVAIVEDREQLQKILDDKTAAPEARTRAGVGRPTISRTSGASTPGCGPSPWPWTKRPTASAWTSASRQIDAKATAIIVYTSGTTGPPKGAMISHENIVTLLSGSAIVEFDERDMGLSFLPMAHVAERVLAFYGRINYGTATAYASSVPAVLEELKEIRPDIFGSVPRIFEKAYARIQSEVEKAPPGKQKVFRWAECIGHEVVVGLAERQADSPRRCA